MSHKKINDLKTLNESIKLQYELTSKELQSTKEELVKKNKEADKYKKLYNKQIEPVVANKWNLKETSKASANDLKKVTKGTGLEGLEQAYVEAERKYGVSAIFLLALTAHESSWGKSYRAVYQNNLTGYNVTSDEAKGKKFASKESSILETAKLLGQEYLDKDGLFYTGSYDIYTINKTYCPVGGFSWSKDIVKIMNQTVDKINKGKGKG